MIRIIRGMYSFASEFAPATGFAPAAALPKPPVVTIMFSVALAIAAAIALVRRNRGELWF
jgi:hypothetical protein